MDNKRPLSDEELRKILEDDFYEDVSETEDVSEHDEESCDESSDGFEDDENNLDKINDNLKIPSRQFNYLEKKSFY